MSAIAGSLSLAAPVKARGMGFKSSAPMGSKVAATAVPARPARARRGALEVVAGNTNEGGLFAPIVVVARNIIGVKRFNQIRGKAIALHSQVRVRSLVPPPAKAAQRHHRERLVSARITNDPPARASSRCARETRARRVPTRRNPARPPSPRHSARDGPPPDPSPPPPRPALAQVITDFCKEIGADGKVRQNLIRTAKNNGGRLGFLA